MGRQGCAGQATPVAKRVDAILARCVDSGGGIEHAIGRILSAQHVKAGSQGLPPASSAVAWSQRPRAVSVNWSLTCHSGATSPASGLASRTICALSVLPRTSKRT